MQRQFAGQQQFDCADFEYPDYYVMCVVRDPVGASTLNLRCPVVINPDLHRGMQVILDDDSYEMRHRLDSLSQGEVS